MEGRAVDFKTTAEAKAAGIAVIYQEPTLFPDLTVTENVFMGLAAGRRVSAHRSQGDAHRSPAPSPAVPTP